MPQTPTPLCACLADADRAGSGVCSTWFRLPGINTPQWVYDRNFSVANHTTEVDIWDYYRTHIDHDFEIPQQQQQQEGDGISKQLEARVLRAVISHLVSFQLPFDRALWHTHILRLRHTHSPRSEPDADTERASTVLLCRIHHTIGDGISLIRYTLSTCAAVKPSSAEAESASSSLSKGQQQQQQQPPRATTGVTLTFMQVFMTVLTAPFVGMALLLQRPDSVSFLRRPNKDAGNTRPRVTTWVCPSFPLQSIKAIAAQHKATVNDVMVAIIARAIRLHADKVAADNPSVKELQHIRPIKAFVPVGSAFASEHDKELKNSFGFLFVRLPVDASSALRCLALAKREMDALKRSTLPLLTFISSAVSGAILAPIWLVLGTSYYTSLASLVFSNVKGPEHPIELAGYHVEDMTFLVPQAGGIGFGTSILSYNGQVSIGLNAVSSVFPIEGQEEGFAHRCRLAYMELLRASNEQ